MKKTITLFLVISCLFLSVACNNNLGHNNNAGMSAIEIETLEIERNHYSIIEKGLAKLTNSLKNPASLEVKTIIIVDNSDNPKTPFKDLVDIYVEYSAKNDFGNLVDGYATIWSWGNGGVAEDDTVDFLYQTYYNVCMGKDETYEYISRKYYKNTRGIIFMVDLNDYDKQGYLR